MWEAARSFCCRSVGAGGRGSGREWIQQRDGRWFAWVHVYDPHAPYRPPPPFDREYAAQPYYGEVAATDQALGPLLAACAPRRDRRWSC